ncbi:hypothetical protein VIGAN_01356100 [Vigna angularis var. angularis]|uniref:Uncharacterized protein n=1 Tax=Vigna angularis var. angularis TaxID=157739 RepID=A0A0S3R4S8_PHAAN|nr:hypothetical protein VIGAN_01356100 [Vigna angularis var. angularis]
MYRRVVFHIDTHICKKPTQSNNLISSQSHCTILNLWMIGGKSQVMACMFLKLLLFRRRRFTCKKLSATQISKKVL